MQKCLLISNRNTKIAEYLEKRSIFEVTAEHTDLTHYDINSMDIVDVDKLVYLHYESDDGDVSFRADMNALRRLLSCAYFNVESITFILVNDTSSISDDLIRTAIKSSNLTDEDIEIIHHDDVLQLDHVAKYLSGSASGTDTASTYRSVYITQSNSDEKDRFDNNRTKVSAVLLQLTDSASIYSERARVEASTSGRIVTDTLPHIRTVDNFTSNKQPSTNTLNGFILTGMSYSGYENVANVFTEYSKSIGERTLIVNLIPDKSIADLIDCELVNIDDISSKLPIASLIAGIDVRLSYFGYLLEFIDNFNNVDNYIFLCPSQIYNLISTPVNKVFDSLRTIFVCHYSEDALTHYIQSGLHFDTFILSPKSIKSDFDIISYKEYFDGTSVLLMPTEYDDYSEFYHLIRGE